MQTLDNIQVSSEKEDLNQENEEDRLVKYTFFITYAFLVTTATITFIEAIRNKDPKIRHILNLETCISIVAAYFYGVFIKKINVPGKINFKQINVNRYVDWAITTPIMLLVLLLAFCYNSGKSVIFWKFLIVLILNYAMLTFGYLGETRKMNRVSANILGFVFFIGLYMYIYATYLYGQSMFDNQMIFWAFFIFWLFYGVAYWFKEKQKNISYNILDLFSKCFVGIFFWAYFTKSLVLS
mgnify:FL=1